MANVKVTLRYFLLCFIAFGCGIISNDTKPSVEHPFELKISNHEYPLNLKLDKPWEERGLGYINVIRTDSLWHLWYESFGKTSPSFGRIDYNSYFCYAYSADGVHWVKPNLEITKYDEHTSTNILISNNGIANKSIHGATVFLDPNANESEGPYKMAYARWIDSLASNWVYGMTSKDGINWENERIIKRHYSDTQTVAFFTRGSYRLYYRYWNGDMHGVGYRQIGFSEGDKFDESLGFQDRRIGFSNEDVSTKHLYNNAAKVLGFKYEFIFPSIFFTSRDQMILKIAYRELAIDTSGDTFDFYGFNDENLFIGLPEFRGIYVAPQAVKIDDNKYWIYYVYKNESHSSWTNDEIKFPGNIGRFQLEIIPKDK